MYKYGKHVIYLVITRTFQLFPVSLLISYDLIGLFLHAGNPKIIDCEARDIMHLVASVPTEKRPNYSPGDFLGVLIFHSTPA